MYSKIFCFIFVLNSMWCSPSLRDEFEDLTAGKAPFFEMPCMRVGGVCARGFACPPGMRVGRRGLCPDQQQHGMECCRPFKIQINCHARHGKCVPQSYKCPLSLRVADVTDCAQREVCCVYD